MIRMREVHPEDKDMLREWRNLPEVAKYMYTDHTVSPEEHERWFKGTLADPARKYWIIQADGEDAGLANLYSIDPRNKRCYWAFYLASPNVRGKGVGGFVEYFVLCHVFDGMGFNKLCAEVLAFNDAVVQMHKGFGFVEEGRFRQHVMKGGVAQDIVCLGMLKEEWNKVQAHVEARLQARGLIAASGVQ